MAAYKKEWFSKSQVDYFSSFITLWLSCNMTEKARILPFHLNIGTIYENNPLTNLL
jgi:hypothetical protein